MLFCKGLAAKDSRQVNRTERTKQQKQISEQSMKKRKKERKMKRKKETAINQGYVNNTERDKCVPCSRRDHLCPC